VRYGHRLRVRVVGAGRAVTVDAVDGDGPTIEVKLARTADTTADEARITVYGLRPGYLSEIVRDGATCQVSAGLGSLSGLCTGRIVPGSYTDGVSGQDRVTSWTMLDGRAELRDVTVSRSWTSTDSETVWAYLVAQSGLPVGSLRPGRVIRYPRGYVLAGGWRRAAERIAEATRSRWVVQSGTLQVWPDGETLTARRLVLGADQIVGDPASVDGGRLRVATVYTGRPVNPGDTWRMDGGEYAGTWTAEATEWSLSSGRSPSWYMTITGRRT
jgi:hypothetical protein